MKRSLTLFLSFCILFNFLISCSEKNNLLKTNKGPLKSTTSQSIQSSEPTHSGETQTNEEIHADIPENSKNSTKVDEVEEKEPTEHLGNCFMKIHNWFYDLNPITPKNKNMIIRTDSGEVIEFNVCNNVPTDCTAAKGLVVEKKNCNLFGGSSFKDKSWVWKNDSVTHQEKLVLNFPQGSECISGGNNTVTMEITCDPDQKLPKILDINNTKGFALNQCHNTIRMSSKYACRTTQFVAWYKSLGISKYIVGAILGVIGLLLIILGNSYPAWTCSLIIAFSSGIIIRSFFSPIYAMPIWVAFIFGIGVAYLLTKYMPLVNTVLAIIIGYFLGNIIYNFTVKIFTGMDPDQLFLITLLSCITIVLIFSWVIDSLIIIVATCLIGSYCFIRGLSICFGGFPDETYTSKLVIHREFNQLARVFGGKANLYLLGMLVVFLLALVLQGGIELLKLKKDDEKKEEKNTNSDTDKENKESEVDPLLNKENKDQITVDVTEKKN